MYMILSRLEGPEIQGTPGERQRLPPPTSGPFSGSLKLRCLQPNGGLIVKEEREPRDGGGVENSQPKELKQGVL